MINELVTGTIKVLLNGQSVKTMSELKRIASDLNIKPINGVGSPFYTHQLSSVVLRELESRA